jgi:hypothetical protein
MFDWRGLGGLRQRLWRMFGRGDSRFPGWNARDDWHRFRRMLRCGHALWIFDRRVRRGRRRGLVLGGSSGGLLPLVGILARRPVRLADGALEQALEEWLRAAFRDRRQRVVQVAVVTSGSGIETNLGGASAHAASARQQPSR